MPHISLALPDAAALFVWWSGHIGARAPGDGADLDFSAPVLWHVEVVGPPLMVRVVAHARGCPCKGFRVRQYPHAHLALVAPLFIPCCLFVLLLHSFTLLFNDHNV